MILFCSFFQLRHPLTHLFFSPLPPPLCLYFDLYVCNTISMILEQSLCLQNNLYVCRTISMIVEKSLRFRTLSMIVEQSLCLSYALYVWTFYNLYVCATLSMIVQQSLCAPPLSFSWAALVWQRRDPNRCGQWQRLL